MRLFIAINLPPYIKEYFFDIQRSFEPKGLQLNHNPHLTLEFLGETDKKDKICSILNQTISAFQPFQKTIAVLSDLGCFDDRFGKIRVIWLGLQLDDILLKIQKSIDVNLRKLGFEFENRRFTPHITIARVQNGNSEILRGKIRTIQIEKKQFVVESIDLMESQLHTDGAGHIILKKFVLC